MCVHLGTADGQRLMMKLKVRPLRESVCERVTGMRERVWGKRTTHGERERIKASSNLVVALIVYVCVVSQELCCVFPTRTVSAHSSSRFVFVLSFVPLTLFSLLCVTNLTYPCVSLSDYAIEIVCANCGEQSCFSLLFPECLFI